MKNDRAIARILSGFLYLQMTEAWNHKMLVINFNFPCDQDDICNSTAQTKPRLSILFIVSIEDPSSAPQNTRIRMAPHSSERREDGGADFNSKKGNSGSPLLKITP